MRASIAAFLLALVLASPLPAAPDPAPRIRHPAGGYVGPCKRDKDCWVASPSRCCSSCAEEPRAVLTGAPPSEACGCALEQPRFDGPACEPVEPASRFKAVCKKERCLRVRLPVKKARK